MSVQNHKTPVNTFLKRGVFYYQRRVPIDLLKHYKTKKITLTLRTKDARHAGKAARKITCDLDNYWLADHGSLGAFDYTIYGSIKGELTYISSDTLTEEGPDGRPETYYWAHITIAEDYREHNPKFTHINLKPGMTADINITTSRRTIITYLSKPITRAFSGALTEK